MTTQTIMVQILHEVTGHPKKELRRLMKSIRAGLPDQGRGFDREHTPDEAEELLNKFRQERAGILRWLHEGAAMARLEMMPTGNTRH